MRKFRLNSSPPVSNRKVFLELPGFSCTAGLSHKDDLMNISKWIRYLNEVCTLLGSGMFVLLTIICFMQVVLRYFFNAAQDWPEEASRFLFIWIAYLGMGYAMYAQDHLKVDVIYLLFGEKRKKWLDAFGHFVSLGFMGLIAWEGWWLLEVVIESEEVALTLPIPLYLVWFAIPFTFALTGVYCLYNLYAALTREGGAES